MKIALLSDLHTNLRSRQAECWRVLDWIAGDLRARAVDLVLLGGDLFEVPPSQAEEDRAAEWILELADVAPVIGVMGNHDLGGTTVPRRRLAVDKLGETPHPITIADRPCVVTAGRAAVACLPWPRGGHLLSAVGTAGREQRYQAGIAGLRDILQGLGAQLAEHDGPRILLSHCHVRGVRLGAHVPERIDFELGVEDLALAGADFVGLGHIHRSQHFNWSLDGRTMPVVYPGSPYRCSFGEAEEKGYVLAQFGHPEFQGQYGRGPEPLLRGWEFVPTPATPMVLREVEWSREGFFTIGGEQLHEAHLTGAVGAEVRLRFRFDKDQADAAKRAAAEIADLMAQNGAVRVALDEDPRPTVRARMPEITTTESIPEQVAMWLRGQGIDEARIESFRGLIADLEGVSQ